MWEFPIPTDTESYVWARNLPGWQERYYSVSGLVGFLDSNRSEIRSYRQQRRLMVHVEDWRAYWERKDGEPPQAVVPTNKFMAGRLKYNAERRALCEKRRRAID